MSILSDPEITTTTEQHALPDLGSGDVESCRRCGSAVARDQRYCLSCGGRRNERRVPFAETLGKTDQAPAVASQAKSAAAITPGIAAAIVCASVLFLGTGVLIGRSGDSSKPVASAAPQIVTVPAGGGGDTGSTADTGASSSDAGGKQTKTVKKTKYVAPPKLSAAAQQKLNKSMNCKTEAECQDAMKKIPNDVVTPGAPPPVDGKPPAGGAKGMTFGQ